jgi:hypothetical protein
MLLTYDKGLSKYAVVKALFPNDPYTHRLKRLQRAAREGVWNAHFDIVDVMLSHDNNGSYIVGRLIPKNKEIVKNNTVDVLHFRQLKRDLLFNHERYTRPRPKTWVDRVIDYLWMVSPF